MEYNLTIINNAIENIFQKVKKSIKYIIKNEMFQKLLGGSHTKSKYAIIRRKIQTLFATK